MKPNFYKDLFDIVDTKDGWIARKKEHPNFHPEDDPYHPEMHHLIDRDYTKALSNNRNSQSTVQIRDKKDNLHYEIVLDSRVLKDDTGNYYTGYRIEVLHYFYDEQYGTIVMTIPDESPVIEECFDKDYFQMMHKFDLCVQRYTALVDAETLPFQSMDSYAEKTGYTKTCPKCCKTCKWAFQQRHDNRRLPFKEIEYEKTGFLECRNPENQYNTEYGAFSRREKDVIVHGNQTLHPYSKDINRTGWQKFGWMDKQPTYGFKEDFFDKPMNTVYPRVEDFGCCENYEQIPEHEYHPNDNDSAMDIISRKFKRMSASLDERLEEQFNYYTNKILTQIDAISIKIDDLDSKGIQMSSELREQYEVILEKIKEIQESYKPGGGGSCCTNLSAMLLSLSDDIKNLDGKLDEYDKNVTKVSENLPETVETTMYTSLANLPDFPSNEYKAFNAAVEKVFNESNGLEINGNGALADWNDDGNLDNDDKEERYPGGYD